MGIPALDAECSCDLIPQSVYGAVGDEEVLVRILTNNHYEGAKVKTSAFRISDIIADGVSLTRLSMVNVAEFQAVAEDIRRLADAAEVRGAFAARAALLRGLLNENGSRKLCVFDDPVVDEPNERDNPAHCMAVAPSRIEQVDAQEIRFELMRIFSEARYLNELWQQAA